MTPDSIQSDSPADAARWDIDTTRRQSVALARWVSLGSLGLMLCLWLAIFVSNGSIRDAAIGRATESANNLSAAFCEQVYDTLTAVNAAIDMTARELRADPAGFQLDRWAGELAVLAHPTMFASLIDPNGRMISNTAKPGVTGMDLSDREHIRVHLTGHDPGLFVSVPLIGRVTGNLTIEVSKRVDDTAGHILGILVFSLAPDDLTALHRLVSLGPRGVIALVGADGRLRARFGEAPEGGTPLVPGGQWPLMLGEGVDNGVLRSDAIDGVSRIYSLRRLPTFPLIVAAGLSVDDELSEARSHSILVIVVGIAASVLLAGLNMLLVREIRRRSQREQELAREHVALESARAELLIEQGKLADVNQELILSSQRAEAASLAKSQFLAQMSHELRTPLHAVIGFSELISHHVAPIPSAGQIAGFAADIMKSGRHLLELINSILDLSKVESGTASLSEDIVPLGEVIQDSLTTIREQAIDAGVVTGSRLPAELPRVHGDTTKLRQIFINLLSNAVKFTPRGGSVNVSGRQESDGGFTVIVADTGIGMNEAEMAIAMEPFGQVENSLARSFEGTGLGLPLAQRLTELHGGRLVLRSVKGVGTTVEIVLPASRVSWPSGARNAQGAQATSG
jgi:signal transduction histidine kinase